MLAAFGGVTTYLRRDFTDRLGSAPCDDASISAEPTVEVGIACIDAQRLVVQ